MKDSHEAYNETRKIDKQINDLLDKHPVTKDNLQAWKTFVRTINSSIKIIELIVDDIENPVTEIKPVPRIVYNLKWVVATLMSEKRELTDKLRRNGKTMSAPRGMDVSWLPNLTYSDEKARAFIQRCGLEVISVRPMK
jgi:hypothetical protein